MDEIENIQHTEKDADANEKLHTQHTHTRHAQCREKRPEGPRWGTIPNADRTKRAIWENKIMSRVPGLQWRISGPGYLVHTASTTQSDARQQLCRYKLRPSSE